MDTSSRPRIVVVGSYGVGLSLVLDHAPAAGETVVGRSFSTGHGGKGSNQAVAAARLGAHVSLITVVGSDAFGNAAFELWATELVDSRLVRTAEGSTMVGMILVEASGENRIAIVPGVLDLFVPGDLDGLERALDGADVLVVGLEIPIGTAHHALRIGREMGVTTMLNPAPAPASPLPDGMLELVDHLTPNRSEAAILAGLPVDASPQQLIESPAFTNVSTLVVTLGGDGAAVAHDGEVHLIDAVQVPVVDTTGAGDTFSATYAVSLARGAGPVEAARVAVHAAALCVTKREVIPSLPYLSDLEGSMR